MERIIIKQLRQWKESKGRKPLILEGARQVGKTWIMKEFGRREYKNTLYINCDNEPRIHTILAEDYNVERILVGLQAIAGEIINGENTLVILDEIQEVPKGMHLLKYLCEEVPWLHVIVAGSLLGIALHKGEAYPVGKVDTLSMYPMSFTEFLDAIGEQDIANFIRSKDKQLLSVMHTKVLDLLRQYYFVGGMPEVVLSYIQNKDIKRVRRIQKELIKAYQNDISKHASGEQVMRIMQVLQSLPSQLAKENKKFIYGVVKKGARAVSYEIAIQWLIDCGLVHKVPRVKAAKMPLKFYEDIAAFKLYFLDCGLLGCLSEADPAQMLIGTSPFVEFKGAFAEQYVLQELKVCGQNPYYWSAENATSEIDFLLQNEGKIIPIEVKASDNLRARSMSVFLKEYPDLHGIRLSAAGFREQERMENIPLYAIEGDYFTTTDLPFTT